MLTVNKLSRNAIRCKLCGDIIESKSVHDFQMCKCGKCFVDGGLEYQRIGGDPGTFENLSEYEEVPGKYITVYYHHGGYNTYIQAGNVKPFVVYHEDQWNYVVVRDDNGDLIYKSPGIDKFLAERHMKIED